MIQLIKRAFLDTEDGQILYRIGGEGEPLLLLHMAPRSSDEFLELMPMLAQERQVIAMDLMGLGDSDRPPREYSVMDYVNCAIALWDQLGIKQCSLLGSLTGGYIAGAIAVAYPERVEKLILCNVPGFDQEEQEKILQKYTAGFDLKEDGSHLMARWNARMNVVDNQELNHRCVIDDLKCFGSPIYPAMAATNYFLKAKEQFSLIECPTLVLSGQKALEPLIKAGLAKLENQLWLSKAISHSQKVELANGTLWMMNQMPEAIAQTIVDFLNNNETPD
ncbi:MAG: alpha/beta hydrolase [Cyanobacteria bacterium P01_G01_bin.67]